MSIAFFSLHVITSLPNIKVGTDTIFHSVNGDFEFLSWRLKLKMGGFLSHYLVHNGKNTHTNFSSL